MSSLQKRTPSPHLASIIERLTVVELEPIPPGLEGFAAALAQPGPKPDLFERLSREVRAYRGTLAGFPTLDALQRATTAKLGLELDAFNVADDTRPAFRVLSPTGHAVAYLIAE